MILVIFLVSIFMFLFYLNEVKKTKFDTKLVVLIGVLSGVSFVLNMIKFIHMPQGGSITLFSMMPVMLIGIIYGKGSGMSAGIILGCLKMLDGVFIIHPMQFILDYILANMFLGLSGIFFERKNINKEINRYEDISKSKEIIENKDKIISKNKMLFGCLFASFLSLMTNVVSGAVFFGEYTPDGMNVWAYSIIYNFSSVGIEAILSSILMTFMPIQNILKYLQRR